MNKIWCVIVLCGFQLLYAGDNALSVPQASDSVHEIGEYLYRQADAFAQSPQGFVARHTHLFELPSAKQQAVSHCILQRAQALLVTKPARTLVSKSGVISAATYDRHGTIVFSDGKSNAVTPWNPPNNPLEVKEILPDEEDQKAEYIYAIACNPKQDQSALLGSLEHLYIQNELGRIVYKEKHKTLWFSDVMAYNPEGNNLAVVTPAGMYIYDVSSSDNITKKVAISFDTLCFNKSSLSAAYNSAGTVIAHPRDALVYFYTGQGGLIGKVDDGNAYKTSIAYKPGGKQIAFGSQSGAITILEQKDKQGSPEGDATDLTWTPGLTIEAHNGWIRALVFSPDGTELLSAGDDNTVKAWNVVTGSLLRTFKDHLQEVIAVKYNKEGTQFFSASFDGMIRVYDRTPYQQALRDMKNIRQTLCMLSQKKQALQ